MPHKKVLRLKILRTHVEVIKMVYLFLKGPFLNVRLKENKTMVKYTGLLHPV